MFSSRESDTVTLRWPREAGPRRALVAHPSRLARAASTQMTLWIWLPRRFNFNRSRRRDRPLWLRQTSLASRDRGLDIDARGDDVPAYPRQCTVAKALRSMRINAPSATELSAKAKPFSQAGRRHRDAETRPAELTVAATGVAPTLWDYLTAPCRCRRHIHFRLMTCTP